MSPSVTVHDESTTNFVAVGVSEGPLIASPSSSARVQIRPGFAKLGLVEWPINSRRGKREHTKYKVYYHTPLTNNHPQVKHQHHQLNTGSNRSLSLVVVVLVVFAASGCGGGGYL